MKIERTGFRFGITAGYLFLIVSLGVSNQVHAADVTVTVTVGVGEQNRAALGFENGRFVGSLAKYYQCAFDKSGLSFDFQVMPHQRVLLHLKRGDISLGLPLVKVERRDDFAVFTQALLHTPFSLFTRKEIDVSDNLSVYTFAVVRRTASVDLAINRKAQFIEVDNWAQALALAKIGRYDGAIIPDAALRGRSAEKSEGLTKLDFGSIPLAMYVSRQINNTDALVERLNTAIDACLL